jgi:hypothetical protein
LTDSITSEQDLLVVETTQQPANSLSRRPACSVSLRFAPEVSAIVRHRISYAFRVFAAIFGHRVIENEREEADVILFYAPGAAASLSGTVWIPALYRPTRIRRTMPKPAQRYVAGHLFHLLIGIDHASQRPDWLGEIFEWLTCGSELATPVRDAIGRIPFSETVFARQHISVREPHALRMMSWLEAIIGNDSQISSLPKAPSPVDGVDHFVVCSHDVDYHYTNRLSALKRLAKNLAILLLSYRDVSNLSWNIREILQVIAGKRTGDYLSRLDSAARQFGFRSTVFVVARRAHRRDPDYELYELQDHIRFRADSAFEIALHGSFRSVLEHSDLAREARAVDQLLGRAPRGSRQHWLRFESHSKLAQTIHAAGFAYDSSIGFPDAPGFRAGASFAYPPYDFSNERACNFLELPLVLMDGSVERAARDSRDSPASIAGQILQTSRDWGWGGIAIDWHNPIEPIQVPQQINDVFWNSLNERSRHREVWTSADEFLSLCLSRYHGAGLLEGIATDAESQNHSWTVTT